ncbi:adventurous gliding motility protein AgmC [Pyxidicoccus trucidator]|uniref:adventurous gliding motility protein AgmC n=1 Tax=Pyxidicoccus trucidator TaxID=2709662 RepID=UPI0013DC7565|nr:MYXO-CTERM sorting domain-containing protein [Pyxidicoccus trucidator]
MRSVPLLVLVLLMAAPARAELDSFGLGTGRSGPRSVTVANTVINPSVRLVANASAGSRVLRPESLGGLGRDALVLIHQTVGFPASTPSGGSGSANPGAVGRWELARVETTGTAPAELRLTAPLVNSYTVPGAQVVFVPEYTNVTIGAAASLVASPWDGLSGGIVAFLATGTVTNQGLVSADGAGLRGAVYVNHPDTLGCSGQDVPPELGGAFKGEGLAVNRFGVASGRGYLVSGGGGGNCHNAGGGGGGHGGGGGTGGRTASDLDSSRAEGGFGGAKLTYLLVEQALFGGGGGAGQGNNDLGSGGGAGGGLVLVRANTVAGAGRFTANGASPGLTLGDDGAGGGGAGGAVIVRAAGAVNCGGVQAAGGAGGTVNDSIRYLGPGGGGSGGYVLLQGPAGTCPMAVPGGASGMTKVDNTAHGASAGGSGVSQEYRVPYQVPTTPAVVAPANGAVGVSTRPVFQGTTDPGVRVIISVDDVEVAQLTAGADGVFSGSYPGLRDPLPAGEHRVSVVAESLGTYSVRSSEVTFNVAVAQADGGVLEAPILVVPADGDFVDTTPLFAGVAPYSTTVGLVVDDGNEITVTVDTFGRFRYQVPDESPLTPGPHFIVLHAHNEAGDTGPFSPATRFESVAAVADAGSEVPDAGSDAGSEVPDAGSDAGAGDAGVGQREVPVMVVPAEDEVVDSTPLFAGVAAPGVSVSIEVDGAEVARVVADATGAFRHPVSTEHALSVGEHSVTAHAVVSATGVNGPRSEATDFEVRGPAALDVGCGCGASPASSAGLWALLVGMVAMRRRRR